MDKICIVYHCSFFKEASSCSMVKDTSQPWEMAIPIVVEQWNLINASGLAAYASKIIIGINGGTESEAIAKALFPKNAELVFHGINYKNENGTIDLLHRWAKANPGYAMLYFHSKGLSKPPESVEGRQGANWRKTMMRDLVSNWGKCVSELDAGYDIVCSTWMWEQCDGTQHIAAGNFLWTKSDFTAKLPSLYERARIKQDGIAALTSRYEAECFWGNGPRPNVKMYRPQPWWWLQ